MIYWAAMDLHTGCPIWLSRKNPFALRLAALDQDVRCQVAIVGAGVTGALLADRLVEAGFDTVLVDSREFGTGSTAASTNLLLCEPDTHLFELEERMGGESARRVYELGRLAIDRFETITHDLPDNCGFSRRTSLYFASEAAHVALLEREYAARQRLNLPVERLDREALCAAGYSFSVPLALRSPIAGEIDAYRLTQALIQRALTRGIRAYSATKIVGHEHDKRGVALKTKSGKTICADAVVYASGYEAHEQLDEKLGTLSSTWAFASEPVESFSGWPNHELIWETARPYIYLRTTPDQRVLMGGADEPYAASHRHKRKICAKTRELSERFSRMFPAIPMRAVSAWAGVFGSSNDGLPFIGRPDPGVPIYYTLGYGGNGITFSVVAVEIIVNELQGQGSSDSRLFRFGR